MLSIYLIEKHNFKFPAIHFSNKFKLPADLTVWGAVYLLPSYLFLTIFHGICHSSSSYFPHTVNPYSSLNMHTYSIQVLPSIHMPRVFEPVNERLRDEGRLHVFLPLDLIRSRCTQSPICNISTPVANCNALLALVAWWQSPALPNIQYIVVQDKIYFLCFTRSIEFNIFIFRKHKKHIMYYYTNTMVVTMSRLFVGNFCYLVSYRPVPYSQLFPHINKLISTAGFNRWLLKDLKALKNIYI